MLRTLVHASLNTIHNVLRILVHTSPPHNMGQARDVMNELATACRRPFGVPGKEE